MTPLRFWYRTGQGRERLAATPEEIDAVLDEVNGLNLAFGTVTTITRQDEAGPTLYAGLDGDVGALYYTAANEGWYSRGDGPGDGDPLVYDWQQHEFLLPPDAAISADVVRSAVKQFAFSGVRPTGVTWQEWSPPLNSDSGSLLAHDDPAWG